MRHDGSRRFGYPGFVFLGVALLVACAPVTRRHVLTFFFDGVPQRDSQVGPEQLQQPSEPSFAASSLGLAPIPPPAAPVVVSVHPPVRERQCTSCHDVRKAMTLMADGMELCDRCHKDTRIEQGWDHGPINLGKCLLCHRPHDSPFPHLLDRPIPELCMHCHEEDLSRNSDYHDVPDVGDCTSCHDPHRKSNIVERVEARASALPDLDEKNRF